MKELPGNRALTLEQQIRKAVRALNPRNPLAELEAALRPVEINPLPPDFGPPLADLGLDSRND